MGIDVGAVATRAVVIDAQGVVVSAARRHHGTMRPQADWAEIDPKALWASIIDCVTEARNKMPMGEKIGAIGLANPGEAGIVWNKKTAEPLYPVIGPQDSRPKINWVLNRLAVTKQMIAKGELCVGGLDTWILWMLTGGKSYVTEPSTAARSGMNDVVGTPPGTLPEVGPSDRVLGLATIPEARIDNIPVNASVVGRAASLFGHGALRHGDVAASLGARCYVSMIFDSEHGSLPVWSRLGKVTHAREICLPAAGTILTWLHEELGVPKTLAELDDALKAVPDSAGVVCVPDSPRCTWLGVSATTTKLHLVRAALEGIAARVAQNLRTLEAAGDIRIRTFKVDGPLTKSKTLLQSLADLLALPVEIAAEQDTAAPGIAYMAMRATGAWTTDDPFLKRTGSSERIIPKMPEPKRLTLWDRHDRAIRLAKDWA